MSEALLRMSALAAITNDQALAFFALAFLALFTIYFFTIGYKKL